MTTVALPIALALIMVSLGMTLGVEDFRRVAVQPRGVLIGLGNLLVLSPLLAFGVAEATGLAAALAVGLVLLGASPGGTTANLMTHLARGDTALSVSMTALSSVAAVITVPLYLGLAIDHFDAGLDGDVSMLGISLRVLLITVVPLSIGMWLRHRDPEGTARREPRFKRIALGAFLLVVIGAIISEFETVTDNFAELAVACLALNVLAMGCSFAIATAARLDTRQATAVALELGIHNGTLAIAVGALVADELTVPAAVYSVFMYWTAGAFARLLLARNSRVLAEAPA